MSATIARTSAPGAAWRREAAERMAEVAMVAIVLGKNADRCDSQPQIRIAGKPPGETTTPSGTGDVGEMIGRPYWKRSLRPQGQQVRIASHQGLGLGNMGEHDEDLVLLITAFGQERPNGRQRDDLGIRKKIREQVVLVTR